MINSVSDHPEESNYWLKMFTSCFSSQRSLLHTCGWAARQVSPHLPTGTGVFSIRSDTFPHRHERENRKKNFIKTESKQENSDVLSKSWRSDVRERSVRRSLRPGGAVWVWLSEYWRSSSLNASCWSSAWWEESSKRQTLVSAPGQRALETTRLDSGASCGRSSWTLRGEDEVSGSAPSAELLTVWSL